MAAGGREKGATEVEKGGKGPMAADKGEKGSKAMGKGGKGRPMVADKGEKRSLVVEKRSTVVVKKGSTVVVEKGSTVVADKGKGVEEVADGDMITLKSSDGKPFEVSKEAAARLSKVLAEMIAGGCSDGGIKLDKIGAEALENMVDYCNKHANSNPSAAASSFSTAPSKELEEWDRKLVGRLSQDALFDLVEVADFLSIDGLLDVTCRKIADMMKGKSPAQIREMFNIENDFTKDEEEDIRWEHAWAFAKK